MELALFKKFDVPEKIKAQFRVQAYNLTNTPHFAKSNSNLGHYTTACPTGLGTCPGNAVLAFTPNNQFGVINNIQPL